MTEIFTENELVNYLYGNVNQKTAVEIQRALLLDEQLQEQYSQLKEAHDQLDRLELKPSQKVIDNIMQFSKNFEVQSA